MATKLGRVEKDISELAELAERRDREREREDVPEEERV